MTPLSQMPRAAAATSNKQIVLVVAGIVAVLALLVVLFVGGIVGFVFYTLNHSEAAQTARTFLRQNERLRQDIGEVKNFGWLVVGNIHGEAGNGQATLTLKVIGARKTVSADVELAYRNGSQWRVVSAAYRNEAGRVVRLLDRYDEEPDPDPATERTRVPPAGPLVRTTTDDAFASDVLQAQRPVLVEFIMTFNDEGARLAPTVESLATKYAGRVDVVRMNVSAEPQTYQQFNVVALPTFILFNHGREQERTVGMRSLAELADMLDKHLPAAHTGTGRHGQK
jgi:thioredoxin 1